MTSAIKIDQHVLTRLLLDHYPSDDDNDLVHGPGGPRLKLDAVHAAWVARFLAREALSRYRIAESLGEGKVGRRVVTDITRQLLEDLDDWCGTPPPRRWPFPLPGRLRALDVFTFAAHMQSLALDKGPLQQAYQAVADAGFERGLKMLGTATAKRTEAREALAV